MPLDVSIAGRDGCDEGLPFFGSPACRTTNPSWPRFRFQAGIWQLRAVPAGGWRQLPKTAGGCGLWIALAAALIMIPTLALPFRLIR